MAQHQASSRRRSRLGLVALVAGITLNVSLVAATALTALSFLPTVFRTLTEVQPKPAASSDWSAERLGDLLREQILPADCVATEEVISDAQSPESISQTLDEVGLDIYQAREALEKIEAPKLGFVTSLTEQVELEGGRVLAAVLDSEPEFENELDFETMLNRATLELVSICALEEPLGEALAAQQKADSALERLKELAAEAAWYPRGFTRSLENLAWGWTSDSGASPCENCVYWKVTMVTRDGCLGGGLIEIRISDGEAELTRLQETWPRLQPQESVTAEFPYQQLNPDLTAQVTLAECFAHEQP